MQLKFFFIHLMTNTSLGVKIGLLLTSRHHSGQDGHKCSACSPTTCFSKTVPKTRRPARKKSQSGSINSGVQLDANGLKIRYVVFAKDIMYLWCFCALFFVSAAVVVLEGTCRQWVIIFKVKVNMFGSRDNSFGPNAVTAFKFWLLWSLRVKNKDFLGQKLLK